MKTINVTPGTPEWHAHRAWPTRNASDAPAMMGCGDEKRTEFMHRVSRGLCKDVSGFVQERVLDPGHRYEALARPLAEAILDDILFPVVGMLEGTHYSASFDGLTLETQPVWEHKRLNADLRAVLPRDGVGGPDVGAKLPLKHRIQMEQQCMVADDADRALFTASEWDEAGNLVEARHCWYEPDAELRAAIINGWEQFDRDLAAYVPAPASDPAPVGKAPDTLPALLINVTGAVTASNLPEFKATALAAIRSVNRDLKTDQDFADADKAVKWCAEVEDRLKAAKEHALSQTASIDALFKALDDISAESRAVRLDLEKLVEKRKRDRKEEAVMAARRELDGHIATLNAELAPMALRPVVVDFAGAIKGLRSFASMDDALRSALATGKIAADAQAKGIRGNVATFKAKVGDENALQALFPDLHMLVHKAADDFGTLVDARIAQHRAVEAAKEAKRKADEAARIAAAEARAREEAAAAERQRIDAEQHASREAEAQRQAAAAVQAAKQIPEAQQPQQVLKAEPATADATDRGTAATASPRVGAMGAGQPADAGPAVDDGPADLSLGAICTRLGFTVSAAFLAEKLHVPPSRTDKAARLYTERQFQTICRQLVAHVSAMAELNAAIPA